MLASAVGASLACACSDGTAPQPEVLGALPRGLSSQESALISAGNAFTLNLFQKASLAEPARNVFLSPLSASMSLGMTLNGAQGETFDAMRTALDYGQMPVEDINAGSKSLLSLLTSLDPTTDMRVSNSIWFRKGFPVRPDFVGAGREYFGAEVAALDFADASASLKTINGWVNQSTSGRIPSVVDEISPDEQVFLVNAIYFKGSWRTRFDRSATQSEAFHPATGAAKSVPMMHLAGESMKAARFNDGTVAAELPYGNTAFNMVIVLPAETESLDAFVGRLTPARWAELTSLPAAELTLALPRVELEYRRVLNADLAGLGMGVAFTDRADFGRMTTTALPLAISTVVQKTFLKIDEDGTEAAAATVTGMRVTSTGPAPIAMRCDRPYLIAIRERLSGTVLFIGKINTM